MSVRRRRGSTPVHADNPLPFFEVVRATQASDDECLCRIQEAEAILDPVKAGYKWSTYAKGFGGQVHRRAHAEPCKIRRRTPSVMLTLNVIFSWSASCLPDMQNSETNAVSHAEPESDFFLVWVLSGWHVGSAAMRLPLR